MSEMIDRVATEIAAHIAMSPGCPLEDVARAAIEAMRPPQYEIIRAMSESRADSQEGQHPSLYDLIDAQENFVALTLEAAWTAAINQALKETQ